MTMRLLHFCPISKGGVAVNAHHQAQALCGAGVNVTMLCPDDWLHDPADTKYSQKRILVTPPQHGSHSRIVSRLLTAKSILRNMGYCSKEIKSGDYVHVLFASFMEYLAPLWVRRLKQHQKRGVWFGVMALDPVRDYVVGPRWWHNQSIELAYSFCNDAFVHHAIDLSQHGGGDIQVTVVPHGEYPMPSPTKTSQESRQELQIPDGDSVALCYGHLRDNKNLQLAIEALSINKTTTLVVAGSEAAPGQIQSSEYKNVAEKYEVADRIRWMIGYQSDQDTANLFELSDVALLPYDNSFVSVSGILYVAAPFGLPLIISCGDGSLAELVENYGVGVRMKQPTPENIASELEQFERKCTAAQWKRFRQENSYQNNATILIERMEAFTATK